MARSRTSPHLVQRPSKSTEKQNIHPRIGGTRRPDEVTSAPKPGFEEIEQLDAKRLPEDSDHPRSKANFSFENIPTAQAKLITADDLKDRKTQQGIDWSDFRTRIDDSGSAEGFGVALENSIDRELQTNIQWEPTTSESGGQGVKMTAEPLGPDHPLGSKPHKNLDGKRDKLNDISNRHETNREYISGHLLNQKLGGPGDDARNITAIPSAANSLQSSHVEEEVKDLVNRKHLFVFYEVDIEYSKAGMIPYAEKITSSVAPVDEKGKRQNSSLKKNVIQTGHPTKDLYATSSGKLSVPAKKFTAKSEFSPGTDIALDQEHDVRVTIKVLEDIKDEFDALDKSNKKKTEKLELELEKKSKELDKAQTKQIISDGKITAKDIAIYGSEKTIRKQEKRIENLERAIDRVREKLADTELSKQLTANKIKRRIEETYEAYTAIQHLFDAEKNERVEASKKELLERAQRYKVEDSIHTKARKPRVRRSTGTSIPEGEAIQDLKRDLEEKGRDNEELRRQLKEKDEEIEELKRLLKKKSTPKQEAEVATDEEKRDDLEEFRKNKPKKKSKKSRTTQDLESEETQSPLDEREDPKKAQKTVVTGTLPEAAKKRPAAEKPTKARVNEIRELLRKHKAKSGSLDYTDENLAKLTKHDLIKLIRIVGNELLKDPGIDLEIRIRSAMTKDQVIGEVAKLKSLLSSDSP